ncbi:MAG: HNH endonuclease family protein, partial [Terracidiphilus sp.]
ALYLATGVSEMERTKLLEQWERITFRIFGLLQKDSRTKVGDYVRLASRIIKGDPDYQSFNQIMAELRNIGADYSIKEAVENGLRRVDLYRESPEVCRYILWNYEEFLARSIGSNATIDEHERTQIWRIRATDSLEHIFPQTPGTGWKGKTGKSPFSQKAIDANVHRLGNLLLLPQPLNSEAQARPFTEKKALYEKHNLRMIDKVCAVKDWTFDSIDDREEKLASWAEQRWGDI